MVCKRFAYRSEGSVPSCRVHCKSAAGNLESDTGVPPVTMLVLELLGPGDGEGSRLPILGMGSGSGVGRGRGRGAGRGTGTPTETDVLVCETELPSFDTCTTSEKLSAKHKSAVRKSCAASTAISLLSQTERQQVSAITSCKLAVKCAQGLVREWSKRKR